VVVVIGLAIALLLADESLFFPSAPETINAPNQNVNQLPVQNLPQNETGAKPSLPLTSTEQHITVVARNFSERFASFSTDSNYANLEEVKLLSSVKLILQLDKIIESASESASFYGVSSKVLKVKINSLDETAGLAKVTVTLQREETSTPVYYQDLELLLIRSGEEWLVDSYRWQAPR